MFFLMVLLITGKAVGPRYLLVDGDKNISILQCGIAGEKLVRFACLIGDFNHAAGRGGMGAVFGSKNLRTVGLFNYRDLEDLLRHTTGWDCTMFELMKVGERRINMLRQINGRQGFSSKDDTLPQRLFEKLPDGPAKDRCVDRDTFAEMRGQYYDLMGWEIT